MRFTTPSLRTDGASVVIPVRNGARWLHAVLAAAIAECGDRPFEVIVVDDGSEDESVATACAWAHRHVRVVQGPRRGAAAAVNAGLRLARFDLVAQLDQDVVVQPGWLNALATVLSDPAVAAAQGWYTTDPAAPLPARVMALDLEQRYDGIRDGASDHVCTGNVLWRRAALVEVGGLDESLGYGYDNDLSYRLVAAGHRLAICRTARSFHRWRDTWSGYVRQQYGFGYGRLDLLARHPRRLAGDCVSPAVMMAHPLVLMCALVSMLVAGVVGLAGGVPSGWLAAAAVLVAALVFERAVAAGRALRRTGDHAALLFPAAHLARDLAWVAAIVVWAGRRLSGAAVRPHHSMQARAARPGAISTPDERAS